MGLPSIASQPAPPRRPGLNLLQAGRPWLSSSVVLPVLFSSAASAVWLHLAFFRSSHIRPLLSLPIFFLLFTGPFLAMAALGSRRSASDPNAARPQAVLLARSSLASAVLLVFLPEYLAKNQPVLLRSFLLAALALALYLALCAQCLFPARAQSASSSRTSRALGLSGLAVLFALTTTLALRKYSVFGYVGQDLAYFGQIMYTTAHGHLFWGNLLQDLIYSKPVATDFAGHNSPVMFLLVPLYALAPSPVTLLVIRNLVLIACAAPVFAIARRSLSPAVAWLWVAALLLTPALLYQTVFDFYPLTFAALPLLATVHYYLQRAFRPFCVCLALTLLVREDLVFIAFGLGLVALFSPRPRRWVYVPIAASIVWALLSFRVVLPAALHGATFVTDVCFSHLGQTPAQMLRRVIFHPRDNVLVHGNVVYLKTLLTATGLALSTGSLFSLLALPYIGINLLAGAGRCITTVIFAQYSVIPATLLFVGALLTATSPRHGRLSKLGRLGLPFPSATPLLLIALCLGSLIFVTERPQFDEFRARPWNTEAHRILALIPAHASVAAPRYMLPHLANRDCLYQTHRLLEYHTPSYAYLILDKDWSHIVASADYQQEYAAVVSAAASDPRLTLLYTSPQYAVYLNPAAADRACTAPPLLRNAVAPTSPRPALPRPVLPGHAP